MKIYFISLGCPKNLTDTEVLMGKFVNQGNQITTNPKQADIIVINTCAFLRSARDEAYVVIKEMKKYKKKIYLAGCLPKWERGNREVHSQVSEPMIGQLVIYFLILMLNLVSKADSIS
jgi:ribosomal protein S12 methylthiotransferase